MDARVTEDFHGMSMARFIQTMDDKLHRAAQRKVVSKQASELAKEIRRQIKSSDMEYSRSRTRESRRMARETGQKPLAKTIGTKTWNRKRKGIIGKIVGAKWPEGAHAHLVERGFQHWRSGRMTVQHWYQRDAEERFSRRAHDIAVTGFKDWLRKQHMKGKPVR